MNTTIKTTVNGKSAELAYGGENDVTVAGEHGHWDSAFGGVSGCESLTDGERRELDGKFDRAIRSLLNTRPSARPAVLEVA